MKLSLKHMVISFIAALILFSVIMSVICVSVFWNRVDDRLTDGKGQVVEELPKRSEIYAFSECTVYYGEENDKVSYAVLVCVSQEEKILTLTPFEASLPVPFWNSIYFVSTICEKNGADALRDIASALTGMKVQTVVCADGETVPNADSLDGFVNGVTAYLENTYQGFEIKTFPVVLDKDGVADTEKTVETFFKVKSN